MRQMLLALLILTATVTLQAQARTGQLKSVYRTDRVEMQNANGQAVTTVDGWGRVQSPTVKAWQQKYNAKMRSQFRNLFGGESAPDGIEMLEAQPPGRRGIQDTGLFAVPRRVPEDSVLTRDALSLTFFDLGVTWNYLARALATDCTSARAIVSTLNCAQYEIRWKTPSDPLRPVEPDDRLLFAARYRELQKALAALSRLQRVLASVTTITAERVRADEAADRLKYDERKAECPRLGFLETCAANIRPGTHPPDWMTAQVDSAQLSAGLLGAVHAAERDAQAAVSASIELEKIGRIAVAKAR